jgi:hypothetical protein
MVTTFLESEVERRKATITLSRAEPANAQTVPMRDDFDEAFISAVWRLGMVNNVVPLDDPGGETCAPAVEIAKKHPFAARQGTR